ncbi:MAG: peptidoglycan DD-metalloendopeptidase family protein [Chloroflexi bacterium]|nr:peptidoglycan DD-metalloendopeptidase family protein [Chloroflexota bacterium]
MYKRIVLIFLLLSFLIIPVHSASAQEAGGIIYIVQSGDTLSSIASRFKISVNDLMTANNISDPNMLAEGQELSIPGYEGVNGAVDTEVIGLGDNLRRISRRDQVDTTLLIKINHLISPSELYLSADFIVPQQNSTKKLTAVTAPAPGESLLEFAARHNSDPWTLSSLNNLSGTWDMLPGDVLYSNNVTNEQTSNGLPSAFVSASIPTLPFKQGGTVEIVINTIPGATLSGSLAERQLAFFQVEDGAQVALQGIYGLITPGLYPLSLTANLPDGTTQTFEQLAIVQSGNYPTDPLLPVAADTINPTTNDDETKLLTQLTAPITQTKYWNSQFTNPSPDFPGCHPSYFGNRRNYISTNTNETYHSIHAGLDFCGQVGTPIVSAADGMVVFTGLLTIHGNTTIIDHGWGIYTVYCHQSQIGVATGQQVKAGDLIGLVGETGRVTGPHLHFEVWANGIQVDPLDWLSRPYP